MNARPEGGRAPVRWVPVQQLPELARSLLSEDLGGRDAVPGQVADRVTALAAQWTEHGFTAESVRAWADLTPADAAHLAGRGVDPVVLEYPINTATAGGAITLRQAISSGQISAGQAYDLLVSTGMHPSGAQSEPPDGVPPQPSDDTIPPESTAPPRPAAAVFSHPAAPRDDTGRHHRAQPTHTPFHP